jgi:integrase
MAERKKLTVLGVNNLKPPRKGRREVFDTDPAQLCLRITSKGAKSFAVRLRVKGQDKHIRGTRPIGGTLDGGELTEMRDWARDCLKKAKLGIDPNVEARQRLREQRRQAANTFRAIAEEYVCEYMEAEKLKSIAEHRRIIGKYVNPFRSELLVGTFGDTPIADIRKDDVRALLKQVEGSHGPYMRNRTLAAVRRVFNWAMEEMDAVTATPISRHMAREETSRTKTLEDEEIKAILNASDALGWPYGPFYRLLLLTGQRRGETARMKWDDVDLKKGEWIIPASETKNGAEHLVPLSDTAVALLSSVPRPAEPKGPHIFTTTDGEIPINGFTVAKRRLDRASGITGWRVHDIRRTVRTRLAKIKIPDSIAERVLNHLPGGIVRVYNIHDYAEEKREALDLWAAHLRDIVAPSPKNIIEMKKKIPV